MPDYGNSEFGISEESFLNLQNASIVESLPFQSSGSTVCKIRIGNRWLLLKRISEKHRDNPLYITALEKEFDLGFTLDHPNIVKYLNKGSDKDGLYLLTEYIDGASLRSLITKNPNGFNDKKLVDKIVRQLLDAIEYLHRNNILHLDLKPENILITHKANNVKIIDFGMSASDSYVSVPSGTKAYAAPEQICSPDSIGTGSDFFSLGLIILEMYTGSTNREGIIKIPKAYKAIVEKCINPDLKNRVCSSDEILHLLNKRKSIHSIFLLSIFVAIAFVVLIVNQKLQSQKSVYEDAKPDYKTTTKQIIEPLRRPEVNPGYLKVPLKTNSPNTASADSLLNEVRRPLGEKDSLKMLEFAQRKYFLFIERVSLYDNNPTNRSRKLVLLEIRDSVESDISHSVEKYLTAYKKLSVQYLRLLDVYSQQSSKFDLKIDSLIFRP